MFFIILTPVPGTQPGSQVSLVMNSNKILDSPHTHLKSCSLLHVFYTLGFMGLVMVSISKWNILAFSEPKRAEARPLKAEVLTDDL